MKYHAFSPLVAAVLLALLSLASGADQEPAALTALRSNYEKATERETAPIKENYLKELQKLKAAYLQAGDLESSLAVDGELKGKPVPNTLLPLAKLKDQYTFSRNRTEAALKPTYAQELMKMKAEFTRSENLDAAQAVDAELKKLAVNSAPILQPGSEKARTFATGTAAAALTTDAGRASLGTVKIAKSTWKPLKTGVLCNSDSDKYVWDNVPKELEGLHFPLLPKHAETLEFQVEKGGLIFIATSTRWMKKGAGAKETLDNNELQLKGWKHIAEFDSLSRTDTSGKWMVFCKPCNAGDNYSIRTEKYVAPVVLMR